MSQRIWHNVKSVEDARSAIRALSPTRWTAYAVSWTAATTPPAIGNGTLTGRYMLNDFICMVQVSLLCGSSTTFGSGAFSFSLPAASVSDKPIQGSALLLDSSSAMFYPAISYVGAGLTTMIVYTSASTRSTIPFTWATNDRLEATIIYPIGA